MLRTSQWRNGPAAHVALAAALVAAVAVALSGAGRGAPQDLPGPRFFPDDPVWADDDRAFDRQPGPHGKTDVGSDPSGHY